VTAETCPHYLLLSEGDMDRLGPFGKINPPLRLAEAACGLAEAGAGLRHPLEVIGFLGEEPNDFGLSMVESRTLAGTLDPAGLQRQDLTGRSLAYAAGRRAGTPAVSPTSAGLRGRSPATWNCTSSRGAGSSRQDARSAWSQR
jgi:hypothetical protein